MPIVQRAGLVYFAFSDKDEDGPKLTIGQDGDCHAIHHKMVVATSRRHVPRMIESLERFEEDFPEDEK